MHVCLFDIDGTLLNTGGAGQAAMEQALTEEFGATRRVEGLSYAGRTDFAITTELFAFHGIAADSTVRNRFLQTYLRVLPEHLARLNGSVLPGIQTLLRTLSRRDDVLLGLLTGNFRRGAHLKLLHYELCAYFRCGGFGDDHLDRNDVAGEALREVNRLLQRPADLERVWVIGDTPADVRCARSIGARVMGVATGSFSREQLEAADPDHLVSDLTDPDSLVSLLI